MDKACLVTFLAESLFAPKILLQDYISFVTNDRGVTNPYGTMEYVPWSAICAEYQMLESGIKHPTKFQAVWNYPDGDFLYFNGLVDEVSYDLK